MSIDLGGMLIVFGGDADQPGERCGSAFFLKLAAGFSKLGWMRRRKSLSILLQDTVISKKFWAWRALTIFSKTSDF